MYLINKDQNRISKLKQRTFSELKFRERDHLQEWIANNPNSLGEDLLIIQKEFSGFNETNERLDLLALDKLGNIVIIENKLDDSGKDVTWQAIKYASYCSSLSKQDIIKIYQEFLGSSAIAQEKIQDFYDGKDLSEVILNQGTNTQRIILVAANFRKEVTSTVLWLMNFKIRLQCFKVTPFEFEEQLFLNVEQILPTKDTEEFAISIASKAREEIEVQDALKNRHLVRLKFWENFLSFSNSQTNLFQNNSPTKEAWIAKGIGLSGVNLSLAVSGNYCRSEITFNRGTKDENKEFFDFIFNMKNSIEADLGYEIEWERMDENVTCRIKHQLNGVSYFEETDWNKINSFLVRSSVKMEDSFREPIKKLINYVRKK